MKRRQWMAVRFLPTIWMAAGLIALATPQASEMKRNFDSDKEGAPPAGFTFARTGQGSEGQWVVKKDDSAPSRPQVLAQTSADKTDYRFPLAIADRASYKDFALSVKFKTISGSVDQGAGLIFRLKDKDNYYVVRANALEDNFRLYHVVNGRRVQFAGTNFKVTPQVWHEIKVVARGASFECSLDGQVKITANDGTFTDAGKVGLWTKADSVIYFDDFTVRDLSAPAAATQPVKLLAQALVDGMAAQHPELVRIGMHVTPPDSKQNRIIASNVAAKVGKPSDPEDLKAMRTGSPVALKEGENFDITLPLHDATGKLIGAVGLTFKPKPGEGESGAIRRARGISQELEKKIPSQAALFTPPA